MDKNTVIAIISFIVGIYTALYGLSRSVRVSRLIDGAKNENDLVKALREANYTFVYIIVGFLFVALSIYITKYV